MMLLPVRKLVRMCTLLFPCFAALMLFLNIMDQEGKCTTQHLTYMCGLHAEGKVQGPLCDAMCSERLTIHRCLSMRPEKHVLHASLEPGGPWDMLHDQADEFVLKFSSRIWYIYRYWMIQQPKPSDPQLNYSYLIQQQAYEICMKEFENSKSCHRFGQRTRLYADGDSDGKISQSEESNMFSLLMQREFFMLLALNDSKSTLDLYGYCGGFYAVQKVQSTASQVFESDDYVLDVLPDIFLDNVNDILVPLGKMLGQYGDEAAKYLHRNFVQVRFPEWKERVDFIQQCFGILYDLSSQFGVTVRCCDSHLGNYGITDSGRVVYLDMDNVMSTNAVSMYLSNQECQTDEDCNVGSFDDCSSKCNKDMGQCRNITKQDDLHNFCISTLSPTLVAKTVVLELGVDKKLVKQLSSLVRECEKLPLFTTVKDFREKGILYIWNKFERILRDETSVQ
ncbi:divergent protein kinase domain 1B-like [Branchiostoma floridae x Branchiostoma belcheri]